MHSTLSRLTIISTLLVGLGSGVVHAQTPAKIIAPYIEQETIAIVSVDLTQIDVPTAMKAAGKVIPHERIGAQLTAAADRVANPAKVLKQAGAQIFVVLSLSDLPQPGPFIVIKHNANADQDAVLMALSATKPKSKAIADDLIFSGPETTLKRIKDGTAAERDAFAKAFDAAGDAPLKVVVAPSADQRRVLAEMLPQLPEQLGGGSGRAIAAIDWLSVGINVPPKLSWDVTVQSTSADAARSLKSTLTSLLVSLSQMESVRNALPNVDDLATTIVPKVEGRQLRLHISEEAGNLKSALAAISAPVGQAQDRANRVRCTNNMKQLALGMHIYHDKHREFPPSVSQDEKGAPLLSWRVHLLPHLEQQALYDEFHLNEPWNSAHNKKLIDKMPPVFSCGSADLKDAGKTTYLVPTGEHAIFKTDKGTKIREIRDGTSNTIMIVDASPDHAVIWTKPEDLVVDPDQPKKALGGQHHDAFATAFADGSVRFIAEDIAVKTLRWLFNPDDGNPIPRF